MKTDRESGEVEIVMKRALQKRARKRMVMVVDRGSVFQKGALKRHNERR